MHADRDEEDLNQPGPGSAERSVDVTVLLQMHQRGDDDATARLFEMVYDRLRATAGGYFAQQSPEHTLQPTALVHEACVKLLGNRDKNWESRAHFCAVASTAMRHILRDHARQKNAAKRGGGVGQRQSLTWIAAPSGDEIIDLMALEETLSEFERIDERGARIVELRYFGGLTEDEIARVLDTSLRTVQRTWRRSRAWIKSRLEGSDTDDSA